MTSVALPLQEPLANCVAGVFIALAGQTCCRKTAI